MRSDMASSMTRGKAFLKNVEAGKEYYLSVGSHAAIVRKSGDKLQYLELQTAGEQHLSRWYENGWHDFDYYGIEGTLKWRFGCTKKSTFSMYDAMYDIEKFDAEDDFRRILGYINTAEDEQRKGSSGTIK